jgi:hypothetical protein|tara:strand:+ start:5893 stop:6417 length:525 start_codon:yes stop_codon:yes gene_type:complete
MKRQKYPATIVKVGAVLYRAHGYEYDGRIKVDVDEWIVRSIQRKRGAKSRFGMTLPRSLQEDAVYVNVTERIQGITWGKRSSKHGDIGWLKSISQEFRDQFKVGEDLPPGLYTTKLAALKYALATELESVKWYENKLKEKLPGDERQECEEELGEVRRVITALKTRITKARKTK